MDWLDIGQACAWLCEPISEFCFTIFIHFFCIYRKVFRLGISLCIVVCCMLYVFYLIVLVLCTPWNSDRMDYKRFGLLYCKLLSLLLSLEWMDWLVRREHDQATHKHIIDSGSKVLWLRQLLRIFHSKNCLVRLFFVVYSPRVWAEQTCKYRSFNVFTTVVNWIYQTFWQEKFICNQIKWQKVGYFFGQFMEFWSYMKSRDLSYVRHIPVVIRSYHFCILQFQFQRCSL